jgi:hypothetical protein
VTREDEPYNFYPLPKAIALTGVDSARDLMNHSSAVAVYDGPMNMHSLKIV